jgi:hypothetical protein
MNGEVCTLCDAAGAYLAGEEEALTQGVRLDAIEPYTQDSFETLDRSSFSVSLWTSCHWVFLLINLNVSSSDVSLLTQVINKVPALYLTYHRVGFTRGDHTQYLCAS